MKNKRYLIEVQETAGTLGGCPRIADTRINLARFAELGLTGFKRAYPYVKIKLVKEFKITNERI